MTHRPRYIFKALLLAALVLAVAIGVAPAAAKSKTPCWKTLINDWYDGRIDGTYAIHCYRDALKHLPTDVQTYSSARDDIKQALQERITQSAKTTKGAGATSTRGSTTTSAAAGAAGAGGSGSSGGGSSGGGGGSKSSGGNGSGGGTSGGGSGGATAKSGTKPVPGGPGSGPGDRAGGKGAGASGAGAKSASGPITDVINAGRPSSPDSVPIPLIVLGAVAVLLMAAGAAGFAARRIRLRKVQLASAASLPQRREQAPADER